MCVTLQMPDGTEITTIKELDEWLGREAPIMRDYDAPDDWPDRDCCLCPVDLERLAERERMEITDDVVVDPMRKICRYKAKRSGRLTEEISEMEAREKLTELGCTRHHYIGDGVYVGHDGYQIWLITERDSGWHEIALEEPALAALYRYAREIIAEPSGDAEQEQDDE